MPGTRHIGYGRGRRAARWLGAALLVPVLAACGGGGGGGGGSGSARQSDNGQGGSGGQSDGQRTKDAGNQGGFRTAGEPSAGVQGSDETAFIMLSFPSKTSFEATISKVADCGSSTYATPASRQVPVTDGKGRQVTFTLPKPTSGAASRTICLTVTVDGSSKRIQAEGAVEVITPGNGSTPGNGATSSSGSTPGNGKTPGGGASPKSSASTGAPTGAGSNP
ncbi:hypothetical protein P3T27_005977 [Kitasatospora sp. MAA19]|uniref:hypothetical protein n=1 Tax=unclassified Kitasatospora TaxID=2633591 RepID=UPI002473D080|nr:hypothetical protein [Kitasatospora sp. MAA19]MDH6709231.1 hypothetical protein [Kitasatospora sp. MAA19]